MGQFGHEWIRFDQPYLKIPVGREAIYRITYDDLQQAGFAVSGDPRTFQLYHRGSEQAILISGESDGNFGTGDYIEFYGRANDGVLDSSLYSNPSHQPHRFYNLYSDTTSYFLTLGQADGKRIPTVSGSSTGLSPEAFHLHEKMLILKASYSPGINYGDVHLTTFDEGEGWMGAQILQNQQGEYVIEGVTDVQSSAGKPRMDILLTGRTTSTHQIELSAGTRLLGAVSFMGYGSLKQTYELEWADIDAAGKVSVKVRVSANNGPDRISAGYVRLTFPQKLTMAGATDRMFVLPENNLDNSYINIENPLPGLRLFDVTDPTAVRQVATNATTTLNAVIPETSVTRKIFATAQVLSPERMKRVTFRQIVPSQHNYIIVSHPLLRKPGLGYQDPVKAYASYRALPAGGGFDTLIVNIGQLYDQFNYGEASPRAIFQFMKFLSSEKAPDYLFLIGKGLDVNYGYHRKPSTFVNFKDLVPAAGYPASDMAFTAGLSGHANVPAVATGRLTATTPAEVAAYLNKVKERDALPFNDLGRKKILHISGGIEEGEPAFFRSIMQGFETVAEDLYLGGNVLAVAKQSRETKLVNIAAEVNNGLGLVTFFGHSAPNTTDFDIGLVTNPVLGYDNTGKYPFLLMNGCDAGSFFLNGNIFGENWIKTPDKGAIGFIAHSSFGLVSELQRYTSTFYNVGFGDSAFIQKGVGKVQQEIARRYLQASSVTPIAISQVQQMVLLGDPAVKLFGAQKPDYAVEESGTFVTSFDGEAITALSDSFHIQIAVKNFGVASEKKIRIEVTRAFNDNVLIYDSIFSPVMYSDTLSMVIRNHNKEGFGINTFTIHVDADDLEEELSETNNTQSFEYFFPLNSTRNLYPFDYSIVKRAQVDLSFQYTDLTGEGRTYILELDTANTFDSDYKKEYQITARVLGKQHVELLNRDSTVYYWRTKLAQPLENESRTWATSSFSYIQDGPEGWGQLEFPQLERNAGIGLVKDPQLERIGYQETVSDLAIKTFSSAAAKPLDSVSFMINGAEFNLLNEGGACRNNTINLVAFDRRSTQPYAGLYFKWYELLYEYGNRKLLCGREPYVINSFKPPELITGNQDDLTQYINNIHEGDSVVLFNMGNAGFSQWPAAARVKLAELGISSAQLDALKDGDAVVIFGRKGAAAGAARIFHTPSPGTRVKVNETISGRFTSANMTSVVIGPAQRWDRIVYQVKEIEPVDAFRVAVLGIGTDGSQDTLLTSVPANADLSMIDTQEYPYLKLVLHTSDDINLTSVQLSKWLVIFEPVAEGLIFSPGPIAQQIVFEGQPVSGDFGFINVSDKMFADSLTVQFDLVNHANPATLRSSVKIPAPLPGDTTLFTLPFETVNRAGINDVEVFVNPRIAREKSYDNNVISLREHLNVLADKAQPVIDVTFDGRYLENDEFVSASPSIIIRLWDENPFIWKQDTLGVTIFLGYPCDDGHCEYAPIYFTGDDISWTPADASSDFKIHYSPRDLAPGRYQLRVEVADASGNKPGEAPYEIAFRVSQESSVSADPPYPNPFSLATYFDIVVTGPQATGDFYTLQISDVNGKLVATIAEPTEGLHIGKNTLTWNGMDEYGISLPNGLYLYRLKISGNAQGEEYHGKVVLRR